MNRILRRKSIFELEAKRDVLLVRMAEPKATRADNRSTVKARVGVAYDEIEEAMGKVILLDCTRSVERYHRAL
jgi:hypothetical protein